MKIPQHDGLSGVQDKAIPQPQSPEQRARELRDRCQDDKTAYQALAELTSLIRERDELMEVFKLESALNRDNFAKRLKFEQERDTYREKAEARFPDIGHDPLKLDGDERSARMENCAVEKILNKARDVQQSGVPDQTALVWRFDLMKMSERVTLAEARLGLAKEKAEALDWLERESAGINDGVHIYGAEFAGKNQWWLHRITPHNKVFDSLLAAINAARKK